MDTSKGYAGQVRIWSWSDDFLTELSLLKKISVSVLELLFGYIYKIQIARVGSS
jgi:hypothetical protein